MKIRLPNFIKKALGKLGIHCEFYFTLQRRPRRMHIDECPDDLKRVSLFDKTGYFVGLKGEQGVVG